MATPSGRRRVLETNLIGPMYAARTVPKGLARAFAPGRLRRPLLCDASTIVT
jgi:hypothetical protein